MMVEKYVIGVDFGTDSVRSVVVSAKDGICIGSAVHYYERWKRGEYCNPSKSQFRQHPLDYIEGLEYSIKNAISDLTPNQKNNIVGISVDTTGSTPVAVDKAGTPLALLEEFSDNPNAMFVLWKDHSANKEAGEINELASKWHVNYTQYVGSIYSSEWYWAKMLYVMRVDEKVRNEAFSWVEHCDWISALLTGNTDPVKIKRSRCASGHKAMWHESYNGLPDVKFFHTLDPILDKIRANLPAETYTSDQKMGSLSLEWADKLGLSTDIVIGVGAFDAHMGGVGAGIEPYSLVKVIGTSTCDMLVAPREEIGKVLIHGICGQVEGSIIPGMLGMEAGQSAFGDVYAWFKNLLLGSVSKYISDESLMRKIEDNLIVDLSEEAAKIAVTKNDIVALDWINGRRTPDANHTLKAGFWGLDIGTDAPAMFKALVEATAFGSRAIVERFLKEGIPIKEVIAIGGVAIKSSYVMQTLSNVLNMPIKISASDQACALGASMFAATAAGIYPDVLSAQKEMAAGFQQEYYPDAKLVKVYDKLYIKYIDFGDFTESFKLKIK